MRIHIISKTPHPFWLWAKEVTMGGIRTQNLQRGIDPRGLRTRGRYIITPLCCDWNLRITPAGEPGGQTFFYKRRESWEWGRRRWGRLVIRTSAPSWTLWTVDTADRAQNLPRPRDSGPQEDMHRRGGQVTAIKSKMSLGRLFSTTFIETITNMLLKDKKNHSYRET